MDIDTGDSPPVSSRPYTLALKHHQWVQDEIETLERAGVITKSMSPWASPIVVVPKKSQHGEPPKKGLCIDFRKINNLQQAVITEGKPKGCLSLVPLPKIDEMYAKLKGAKFFSTIDLRSGYYHIALAISQPLSKLTCKDKVFEWTKDCEKAFATLKEKLCAQPILQYADTTKGYTLYTDASKYGWAGVLTSFIQP